MELQQNLAAIRKQVAAISYDSVGVLKSFADRRHIAYPLLSDTDSKIIHAFDILNETANAGTLTYGIPYPGVYIVDVQGKVVSKYFEDDYKDRISTADILTRQYGTPLAAAKNVRETAHLTLTTAASNHPALAFASLSSSISCSSRVCISTPLKSMAIFRSIGNWRTRGRGKTPSVRISAFGNDAARSDRVTVPVYRAHQDRSGDHVRTGGALNPLVTSAGELIIKGSFRYQVRDDRKCYLPQDLPLEWRSNTGAWIATAPRRNLSENPTDRRKS